MKGDYSGAAKRLAQDNSKAVLAAVDATGDLFRFLLISRNFLFTLLFYFFYKTLISRNFYLQLNNHWETYTTSKAIQL